MSRRRNASGQRREQQLVLDTVALRVLVFSHPQGIELLFNTFGASVARVPQEVYAADESTLPLSHGDEELSEFARGLRFAQRRVMQDAADVAGRYRSWLSNARQVVDHLGRETLVIDQLTLDELQRRATLEDRYRIGRGEAAGLVLSERDLARLVFMSSDQQACRVAETLGIPYTTLEDFLVRWVERLQPTVEEFNELVAGMRGARFALAPSFEERLRQQLDH